MVDDTRSEIISFLTDELLHTQDTITRILLFECESQRPGTLAKLRAWREKESKRWLTLAATRTAELHSIPRPQA